MAVEIAVEIEVAAYNEWFSHRRLRGRSDSTAMRKSLCIPRRVSVAWETLADWALDMTGACQ